jgi:hypothetical protein
VIENVHGGWDAYLSDFAHLDTAPADCIWFEHATQILSEIDRDQPISTQIAHEPGDN